MEKKSHLLPFFLCVVLFVLCIWHIDSLYGPRIYPDEVGFWAAGAWFAGQDWSGTLIASPYYGYGYGLLLAPLVLLFHNPHTLYQAAIVLNAGLLVLAYLLTLCAAKKLFPLTGNASRALLCFVVCCYSSNIYNSQTTYVETLILVLVWSLVNLLLAINHSNTSRRSKYLCILAASVTAAYMFAVHMRCLVVVIALALGYLLLWLTKAIDFKQFLLAAITLLVFTAIAFIVKEYMVATLYQNGEVVAVNDFAGQTSKLQYMFSLDGIKSLFFGLLGRITYLGSSTFLLFYVGVASLFTSLLAALRTARKTNKRSVDNNLFWQTKSILLIAMLGAMIMSAISLIQPERLDHTFYGRYHEYLVTPFILFGLVRLQRRVVSSARQLFIPALHMGLTWLFYRYVQTLTLTAAGAYAIAGVYGFPTIDGIPAAARYTLWCALVACLLFFVFQLLFQQKIKVVKIAACLSIGLIWTYFAYSAAEETLYKHKASCELTNDFAQEVLELCQAHNTTEVPYLRDVDGFTSSDSTAFWTMFRLKYYLADLDLTAKDIAEAQTAPLFIISNAIRSQISADDYLLLAQGAGYELYTPYDSVYAQAYYTQSPADTVSHINLSRLLYHEEEGVLEVDEGVPTDPDNPNAGQSLTVESATGGDAIWGPYTTLPAGTYELILDVTGDPAAAEIGKLRITALSGQLLLGEQQLQGDVLDANGNARFAFTFSTDGTDQIETNVQLQPGARLTLNDVSYQRVGYNYTVYGNNPYICTQLSAAVNSTENALPVYFVQNVYEQTFIDTSALQAAALGHRFAITDAQSLNQNIPSFVLIADSKQTYIQSLLPQYTILAKLQGHILLVSSTAQDIINANKQNGNVVFSQGNRINALYYANTPLTKQYYSIKPPSGVYNVHVVAAFSSPTSASYGSFRCAVSGVDIINEPLAPYTNAGNRFDRVFEIEVPNNADVLFSLPINSGIDLEDYSVYLERTGDYVEPEESLLEDEPA